MLNGIDFVPYIYEFNCPKINHRFLITYYIISNIIHLGIDMDEIIID
jgi:hypothetical protein